MGVDFSSDTVHTGDFNEWRSRWLSGYTDFGADFIQSAPLENPYRGIEAFMSAFGSWLVIKEGRLSWRFVQRIVPTETLGKRVHVDRTITDDDIAGEETYALYHPDCPSEYYQAKFGGHTSLYNDGGEVGTQPGIFRLDHESSGYAFDDDVKATNKSNCYLNLKSRIGPWYTRVPDSMRLTLAGWRHADLVPGDVVELQSAYIRNMVNAAELGGLEMRHHTLTPYMVTAIDVDWDGFTVNVELSTPPYSNSRYS